jgi:hypothetical protein
VKITNVPKCLIMSLLAACAGATGCAPWNAAQSNLVTQAQRGITNCVARADERAITLKDLAALRRQRLDESFDQDVRERQLLDPAWVIDHRKAYAVGIDAYAKQQAAQEAAAREEKRDLAAVSDALARLQWLQSIQSRFDLLSEVFNGKH